MKLRFLAALLAAPLTTLAAEAADPAAPVPSPEYHSVFEDDLLKLIEEEMVDWKKANADVGQFPRGHADLLKWEEGGGAVAPAPAPASLTAPAAPATPAAAPAPRPAAPAAPAARPAAPAPKPAPAAPPARGGHQHH